MNWKYWHAASSIQIDTDITNSTLHFNPYQSQIQTYFCSLQIYTTRPSSYKFSATSIERQAQISASVHISCLSAPHPHDTSRPGEDSRCNDLKSISSSQTIIFGRFTSMQTLLWIRLARNAGIRSIVNQFPYIILPTTQHSSFSRIWILTRQCSWWNTSIYTSGSSVRPAFTDGTASARFSSSVRVMTPSADISIDQYLIISIHSSHCVKFNHSWSFSAVGSPS